MDVSSSVPMSSHNSIEEIVEQEGTDYSAPPERGGGAGTHHCGELLGEAINACKMAWESHVLSGLVQQRKGCYVKSSFSAQALIPGLWNCF